MPRYYEVELLPPPPVHPEWDQKEKVWRERLYDAIGRLTNQTTETAPETPVPDSSANLPTPPPVPTTTGQVEWYDLTPGTTGAIVPIDGTFKQVGMLRAVAPDLGYHVQIGDSDLDAGRVRIEGQAGALDQNAALSVYLEGGGEGQFRTRLWSGVEGDSVAGLPEVHVMAITAATPLYLGTNDTKRWGIAALTGNLVALDDEVLILGNDIADPTTVVGGGLFYRTDTAKLRGCEGSPAAWVDIVTGGGAGGYAVTNWANNRIVTSVSQYVGNAEANLQFDGSLLTVDCSAGGGSLTLTDGTNSTFRVSHVATKIVQLAGHTDHVLAFGAQNSDGGAFTEYMRLDNATRRFGIGTTTPSTLLNVRDAGVATSVHVGDTAAGKTYGELGTSADSAGYVFLESIGNSGTSYGSLILNPNHGRVGIGITTPESVLHVVGTAYGAGAAPSTHVIVNIEDDDYAFIQFTSATGSGMYFGDATQNAGAIAYSHVLGGLYFSVETSAIAGMTATGFGYGITAPDCRIHAYQGDASSAAVTNAVICGESNTDANLSLLGATDGFCGVYFGDTDNDVGSIVYNHTTNSLSFTVGTVNCWGYLSTGHYVAVTDDSYDIGNSGALRPRHLFVASKGVIGVGDVDYSALGVENPSGKEIPVLYLDQNDIDDTFINFSGTSATDQTRSISEPAVPSITNWNLVGMYRMEINGTQYWAPFYSSGHA